MKMNLATLAALSFLALITGCQHSVNTVENTDKSMSPQFIKSDKVITDQILNSRLQLIRIDSLDDPTTQLLKVQVTMKSKLATFLTGWFHGNDPYVINYRFSWLDENGMEIKTGSAVWLEKHILPGDIFRLQSVAPNKHCKDFELKLKQHEKQ